MGRPGLKGQCTAEPRPGFLREAAVCDGDPGMGRRPTGPILRCPSCWWAGRCTSDLGLVVRWQHKGPRAAGQVGVVRGCDRRDAGPTAPTPAPLIHIFNKDFLYLPPQIKPREPSTAVLRTAVPTHGHRVNICQAPWASGIGSAHRGPRVARPPSPLGAYPPPLFTCYLHRAACLG